LHYYDFLWLAQYITNWNSQKPPSDKKAYSFLMFLLHYNLSIAHMTKFLGNNYTGAYRDVPSIVTSLCNHDNHYSCVMMVGCPNHFKACTMRKNALFYWRQANHPSIR
jgi:hypothetical protein